MSESKPIEAIPAAKRPWFVLPPISEETQKILLQAVYSCEGSVRQRFLGCESIVAPLPTEAHSDSRHLEPCD